MVNSVIDSHLADMKLYTQTAVFLFDDHQRCLLFSRHVSSIDVSKVALARLLGRAATRAISFCGRFASVACAKFIQIAIALKKRKNFLLLRSTTSAHPATRVSKGLSKGDN
jgi:hypothetical protein